jgi:hypothetical protein
MRRHHKYIGTCFDTYIDGESLRGRENSGRGSYIFIRVFVDVFRIINAIGTGNNYPEWLLRMVILQCVRQ